jgi:hypothetical protein
MSRQSDPLQPLPDNLELIPEFDAITIRRKWRSLVAYLMVFFTLFWNGFMLIWMGITLSQGIWLMAAFGSIHALIGVGLAYFNIASFLNHTDIRIDASKVSIKHRPIPWFGQKEIPVANIQQLYVKERTHRGKNGTSVTYAVHYLDSAQRERNLLGGLISASQATYIENEIEKTLGIKNQAVRGEY